MKLSVSCAAVLLAGAIPFIPATSQTARAAPATPALDSVLARAVAARGGRAALRAVRTERLTGTITFPNGASGRDTVELARPLRIRTTIHLPRGLVVQGYDGRIAWALNTLAGDTAARPLDSAAAANVIAGADLDGPLVDYAAKGDRVTLSGLDTALGRPAWAVRVVRPDGTDDTYFVDTASALAVKWQGRRTLRGAAVVFETDFADFRWVGGVRIPFRLTSRTVGRPGELRIAIDGAAVNVPIPDERFTLPAHDAR